MSAKARWLLVSQKVFVEVAVSKVLRKILRVADKGILYLTAVHYMSQPLIGGFGKAFGEVVRDQHICRP